MFTTVLVAVKLPVPVEDFEAFATETNERIAITITAIFNNLIFLIHLLHIGHFLSRRPSSALRQANRFRPEEKGEQVSKLAVASSVSIRI